MINFGGKYMQYLWLALLVLSALLEGFWTKGIFLCFVPSSLIAMVLAFFDIHIWIQVGVFLLLCGLSFLFLRPILRALFSRSAPTAFTVESAIGTRCTVVEKLDNLAGRGAVTVSGMEWAARTTSDEITVEAGKEVEIIAVEGVKFICREVK